MRLASFRITTHHHDERMAAGHAFDSNWGVRRMIAVKYLIAIVASGPI
jgi:hypothetical protein